MGVEDSWSPFLADIAPRDVALFVLIAILVGNLLCELGVLLAIRLQLGSSHFFNKWLLAAGIIGIVVCSITLFCR